MSEINPMDSSANLSVRPSLRFAGVVICLGMAMLGVWAGYQLMNADGAALVKCSSGKAQIVCELYKRLTSDLPPKHRYILEGLAWWLQSGMFAIFAFNLLGPLRHQARDEKPT